MTNVIKAEGVIEPFNENKLRISLQRSGVPQDLQPKVIAYAKENLYDNIPTYKIYGNISKFLQKSPYPLSHAKYSLRQSILDLGPTGYPFEDYISEILKLEGYMTSVRQILSGKCISHEIDVLAQKDNKKIMIECKFHNSPGAKCQVQTILYTKARFDDIRQINNLTEAWLVTNTKVTSDVLNYALCTNMKVISWDYPEKGNFRELIERHRLYPVTTIAGLTQNQKQLLTQEHVVLAKDVYKNPSSLEILGLPKNKRSAILSECQLIETS